MFTAKCIGAARTIGEQSGLDASTSAAGGGGSADRGGQRYGGAHRLEESGDAFAGVQGGEGQDDPGDTAGQGGGQGPPQRGVEVGAERRAAGCQGR